MIGINARIYSTSGGYQGLVVQAADALSFIADLPPGQAALLQVWRDRAEQMIEVVVDRFETPQPQVAAAADEAPLGIAMRALAPRERQVLRFPGGLLVQRVNMAALRAGVRTGDIIVALNGQAVDNLDALANEVAKADGTVALLVQRGAARLFIPICAKPGASSC